MAQLIKEARLESVFSQTGVGTDVYGPNRIKVRYKTGLGVWWHMTAILALGSWDRRISNSRPALGYLRSCPKKLGSTSTNQPNGEMGQSRGSRLCFCNGPEWLVILDKSALPLTQLFARWHQTGESGPESVASNHIGTSSRGLGKGSWVHLAFCKRALLLCVVWDCFSAARVLIRKGSCGPLT